MRAVPAQCPLLIIANDHGRNARYVALFNRFGSALLSSQHFRNEIAFSILSLVRQSMTTDYARGS